MSNVIVVWTVVISEEIYRCARKKMLIYHARLISWIDTI